LPNADGSNTAGCAGVHRGRDEERVWEPSCGICIGRVRAEELAAQHEDTDEGHPVIGDLAPAEGKSTSV